MEEGSKEARVQNLWSQLADFRGRAAAGKEVDGEGTNTRNCKSPDGSDDRARLQKA